MRLAMLYLVMAGAFGFDSGIYAGDCAISGDSLYYAGGALGESDSNLSPYTLLLNFTKGFPVDEQSNAPWEALAMSQGKDFIPTKYPSVVAFESPNKIVMYGGKGIRQPRSFQVFDPETRSWKVERSAEKSWNLSTADKSESENAYYQFTLTKNDNRVKNFIMYGGLSGAARSRSFNTVARNLNSLGPTWSILPGANKKVYGHVAAVFQEKLFIIGGVDASDNALISMKHIPRFDVAAGLWNNAAAQGDIPASRALHSSAQFNNMVYMAGGSSSPESLDVISDDIYTLDLNTLTWTRITVKGFEGTVSGCMAYYNGILLSSFGYREKPTSKIRVIDTKSWASLRQFPPGGITGLPKSSSGPSLGLIIGCILGGIAFIGLMLGLVSCCLIRKKKQRELKKKEAELRPPELLQGFLWSTPQNNSSPLLFLTETGVPNFDDDVSFPTSGDKSPNNLTSSGSHTIP